MKESIISDFFVFQPFTIENDLVVQFFKQLGR